MTTFSQPHLEGRFHVTVSGGSEFISSVGDSIERGTINLKGVTRKGTEETETLIFLFDDVQTTLKEWESLEEVRVYNIDDADETTISIRSSRFNDPPYKDFWNLAKAANDETVDTFWSHGVSLSGINTLDMIRYTTDKFENLVLAQLTQKEVRRQTEMISASGIAISDIVDIAVQPFTNRVWALGPDQLLVFDRDLFYPDMSQMTKKQYSAIAILEMDNYHKVLGDELEISYVFKRPIRTVARHRAYVRKPDGTIWNIVDSVLSVFDASAWEFGTAQGRAIRNADIYNMD